MARSFDRYVFVDWNGAARPSRGKDSIWFVSGSGDEVSVPQNPSTRAEATDRLRELLCDAAARDERVLVGFDFPYGFPAGFAAALQLSVESPPWRATWAHLTKRIHDAPNNANQRFDDAAQLNQAIGAPPGPFWGHPRGFTDARLTWQVKFPFCTPRGQTLPELRHTERHLRSTKRLPFPVWKLAGQGAVGSQALLGMPRIASLRDYPSLAQFSRIWPFETGFSAEAVPKSGPFVLHAEIWPGILKPNPAAHPIADARQVLALVRWASQLDSDGRLAAEFSPPSHLADQQITECINEEGWTLGATQLRPSATTAQRDRATTRVAREPIADAVDDDPRHHIDALHRAGVIRSDEREELMRRLP